MITPPGAISWIISPPNGSMTCGPKMARGGYHQIPPAAAMRTHRRSDLAIDGRLVVRSYLAKLASVAPPTLANAPSGQLQAVTGPMYWGFGMPRAPAT